jgi:hypothetical protein
MEYGTRFGFVMGHAKKPKPSTPSHMELQGTQGSADTIVAEDGERLLCENGSNIEA